MFYAQDTCIFYFQVKIVIAYIDYMFYMFVRHFTCSIFKAEDIPISQNSITKPEKAHLAKKVFRSFIRVVKEVVSLNYQNQYISVNQLY